MKKNDIAPIETERLSLVSMSLDVLRCVMAGDSAAAGAAGGFIVPEECSLLGKQWVAHRLGLIEADPLQHPWMYRAMVRKADNLMVGYISFHHKAPDPDLAEYSPFAAELGYTVELSHRRQGYARESVLAMLDWAAGEHGVAIFILSISPSNIPSLALAESLGFKKVGERMDEEDGLEYTFRHDRQKETEIRSRSDT